MGLLSKVTNSATNRRYTISTVRLMGAWQTAVLKRRLGPLAYWAPALVIDALEETQAAAHHDRVATIVRDVHPTNWEKAKRALLMEDARARSDISQLLELGATASFAEDLAALGFSRE
jgi:hypothetical protein